jgi:hypothetical protein
MNIGPNLKGMVVSLFFNVTLNDETYIIIKVEMKRVSSQNEFEKS